MKAAISPVIKRIISSDDDEAKEQLRDLMSSRLSMGKSNCILVGGKTYRNTIVSFDEKISRKFLSKIFKG